MSGPNPRDYPDYIASYKALGDDPKTYTVTITSANTAYTSVAMDPGVYEIFVPNGAATDALVWLLSNTDVSPAVASPTSSGVDVNAQAANQIGKRVRVTTALPFVWCKLLTGSGLTLYLSKLYV